MFSHQIEVEPQDLDPVYKHIHHAQAIRYLEQARLALLKFLGCASESFMAQDLFLVIREVRAKYVGEIFAGSITVRCYDPRVEGKLIKIRQQILNSAGKPLVRADVVSVFMSGSSKQAVDPPERFISAFYNLKPASLIA